MADHAGALVAFTGSSTGLARFAGPEDALPWRHQVAGTLLTYPAQSSDGTIYVIDHQPGTSPRGAAINDAVVLAIDGNSGALKYRYALPRSRFVYDSIFPDALANGCTQPPEEYGVSYSAPVIGSDGRAYVTVAPHDVHVNRRWINNACVDAFVEYKNSIRLIALSSSGAVTTLDVLNETNTACSQVALPKQVLTDGGSGIVITSITNSQCSAFEMDDVAYKTVVVNSAGAVATFPSTPNYTITMTSDTGTAYLSPTWGGNLIAKDIATWTTKFTAPVAGPPVVALADGGIVVRGGSGLVFLDGNGVTTSTTTVSGQGATPSRQGEWQAVTVDGNIETVSSTTFPVEARSYFGWPKGNKRLQRQAQTSCGISIPWAPDWRSFAAGATVTYDWLGTWSPTTHPAAVGEAFGKWTSANVATTLNTSFSGPQASPMLALRTGDLPPKDGKPVAAGIPTADVHINPSGFIQSAVIFWTTNTSVLSTWEGFYVTALHEIGHLLGLDDTSGQNGESVMNQMSSKNDTRRFLSRSVTTCDRDKAFDAPTRQWP